MKPLHQHHGHHGLHGPCHGPEHPGQGHEPDSKARDLASFPDGSLVRIEWVGDCSCPRCRVFALGLTPGALVEVVSGGHGPCRLKVRDADLVVGRGIAEKILAVEEEPCPVCAARR